MRKSNNKGTWGDFIDEGMGKCSRDKPQAK